LLAIVAPQLEAELGGTARPQNIQRTGKSHSETITGRSAAGDRGFGPGATPEHSNVAAAAYRARYYVSAFAGRSAS
jgi:hypothetical protein